MFAQELRFPNIYSITRQGKGPIIKRGNVETTWTSIWTKGRRGKILWNSITGSKTAILRAEMWQKKNCSSPILLWGLWWKFKTSRFEKRKLTSSNRSSFDFLRFAASIFSTKLCPLEIPRHHLLRWNLHLVHRKIFDIFFFLFTIGKKRNIFYTFLDSKFATLKCKKF